jgi:hypothetical protein
VKLVERMPRVCKAVIMAKGVYLNNLKSKMYLDLLKHFFGYYMIPYVLFHSLSSLLFYNVENSRNRFLKPE